MDYTREFLPVFNAVVRTGHDRMLSPAKVNEVAVRMGYYFEPAACTEEALLALQGLEVNYNSTFYKDVEDVLKRSRFDQFLDQLAHYASTYGTDFSAPVFTQNPTPAAMLYKNLTLVRAVSPREMFDMCVELLHGPALKNATLQAVCFYISDYILHSKDPEIEKCFNIKDIPNKEARSALYAATKMLPDDPLDFLRLAVYAVTGNGLIINSPELLRTLSANAGKSELCIFLFAGELSRELTEGLASIFYRFKHIFVALKQGFRDAKDKELSKRAVSYINYLRRLAPRYKKPFRADILSALTACKWSDDEVIEAARDERSTFRLVRCLGYLRMHVAETDSALFLIRNGKAYVRDDYKTSMDTEQAYRLAAIIEKEIVDRLRRNVEGKWVLFSDKIDLAAPTSEKNFVGNVPFMSSLRMGESCFMGIYWREEWGAQDFDLSAVFSEGNKKIGWNEDYVSSGETVVYSGDMTSADPEASEIIYFRRDVPSGMIYVNRFHGEEGATYRLFFGAGEIHESDGSDVQKELYSGMNYGVRVMDIVLEADMISDCAEQLTGFIRDGRFYFMALSTGRGPVSRGKNFRVDRALDFRSYSAIDLKELLLKAGVVEQTDAEGHVDIDLRPRALNRTTLINLFK
ncbi:MAG: hypothetical protein K2L96_04335 [Muribaculaceae bacterium]|nr:hypothetical protein [Muribaculaceae bacterium]